MVIEIRVSGSFQGAVRGGEKHALEVGRRLRDKGYDIKFLSWGGDATTCRNSEIDGFPVEYLCSTTRVPFLWRLGKLETILRNADSLRRRKFKPDLVLAFSPWFVVSTYLAAPKVPIVFIVADLLVASQAFERGQAVHLDKKIWFKKGLDSILEFFAYRLSSGVFTSSFWMKEGLIKCGVKKQKIEYGHPGACIDHISIKKSDVRDIYDIPKDAYVVVFSGKLNNRKNPFVLAKAIELLPSNIFLIYLGTGVLEEEMKSYCTSMGIDKRVKFAGWVNDVQPYYQACNVVCHTALYETYGLIYQEALMLGKVILGPKHNPPNVYSAAPEIINVGINGCLFDPMDVQDLAKNILYSINIDSKNLHYEPEKVWSLYVDRLIELIDRCKQQINS